jgi:hypothetical protein
LQGLSTRPPRAVAAAIDPTALAAAADDHLSAAAQTEKQPPRDKLRRSRVVGVVDERRHRRDGEPAFVDRKTNFEVIVGQSVPERRDTRYVGLVHGYDRKPKRRLFDVLTSQGLQAVTFLTDGGEEIRALTEQIIPESEHVLDWFHITMRVTVRPVRKVGARWPSVRPKGRESGMIRERGDLPALASPQVLDGLRTDWRRRFLRQSHHLAVIGDRNPILITHKPQPI